MVRFYLEEETTHKYDHYTSVATSEESENSPREDESRLEMETTDDEQADLIGGSEEAKNTTPVQKSGSFLNINEWGEPEGTKQEVIQKAIFCAVGLNLTFCIWGLVQERILSNTYDGDFFEYSKYGPRI